MCEFTTAIFHRYIFYQIFTLRMFQVKYANSVLRETMSDIDKMQSKMDSALEYAQTCHDKGNQYWPI